MAGQSNESEIITRFYGAMTSGDVAGARACCTPQARFWHCFDGVAQTLEQASPEWQGLQKAFTAMRTQDVRYAPLGDGRWLVQQLFIGRRSEGQEIGWAVCLVVTLRDGLIERVEEYIDRGAPFQISSAEMRAPGLV